MLRLNQLNLHSFIHKKLIKYTDNVLNLVNLNRLSNRIKIYFEQFNRVYLFIYLFIDQPKSQTQHQTQNEHMKKPHEWEFNQHGLGVIVGCWYN
jgi:hypothetical protein